MKRLKVTVDGKIYDVTVEVLDDGALPPAAAPAMPAAAAPAAVPAPLPAAPTPARSRGTGAPGEIKSPLAGKVVSIDVRSGQAVNEGQQVMTLEAMKMNTYIFAPSNGTVGEICVQPGDAVEEGVVLMIVV